MTINNSGISFGTKGSITKGATNLVRKLHGDESANALKNAVLKLKETGCKYDTLKISSESKLTADKRAFAGTRLAGLIGGNMEKGEKSLRIRYERINNHATVKVDESYPVSLLRNLLKTPENVEQFVKDLYSKHSSGDSFLFGRVKKLYK